MNYDRFDIVVYPTVYPPSEDTDLLYDAVSFKVSDVVLDVGCGTGLITLKAASTARRVTAVDISLDAVRNTDENLSRNGLERSCSVIQSDLLSVFQDKVFFSVITFNPPYLPADESSTGLNHALIGGQRGVEVTLKFLQSACNHVKAGGSIYLVASSLADVGMVTDYMKSQGFTVTTASRKRIFFEEIQILHGIKA